MKPTHALLLTYTLPTRTEKWGKICNYFGRVTGDLGSVLHVFVVMQYSVHYNDDETVM